MSDVVQRSVVIDGKTIIIYNNRKADLLKYSDLYDPDNPIAGKVIPSVDSIVVKEDSTLWRVSAVDATTYKSTLVAISYVLTDNENNQTSVISYNNDKFRLYIDKRTNPYKAVVDAKLLFYGTNLKEYVLIRYDNAGAEEIISAYYDNTGKYISDRIPLASLSEDQLAYKYPTNCHTLAELADDQQVVLRVYNNLGVVAAEITLLAKTAGWFNDLQSTINPIVEFNVTALQMNGDDFFVHAKQDPSQINMMPYVIYADGTRSEVPIDSMKCFCYGLEDFVPDYPGRTQTLIFKYFLNNKEKKAIGNYDENFLTCTKKIQVVSNYIDYEAKVTVVPLYDGTSKSWHLRYFVYTTGRDAVYDITDAVTYTKGKEFDGKKLNVEQEVEINFDLQPFLNTDQVLPGLQNFCITVKDPSVYDRYVMRSDDTADHYYGADGSVTRRPVIYYDEDRNGYFIPTSIFGTKDDVIESFYVLADPLYNTKSETKAPTPTHFLLRDSSNGKIIIGGPVSIENYGQLMTLLRGTTLNPKDTVVVEFLLESTDNEFLILYGVPVDIASGTWTYQGE